MLVYKKPLAAYLGGIDAERKMNQKIVGESNCKVYLTLRRLGIFAVGIECMLLMAFIAYLYLEPRVINAELKSRFDMFHDDPTATFTNWSPYSGLFGCGMSRGGHVRSYFIEYNFVQVRVRSEDEGQPFVRLTEFRYRYQRGPTIAVLTSLLVLIFMSTYALLRRR